MGSVSNKVPELPKEFPHIFTEVVFQLIPEVSYNDLVYLSQIVKSRQRQHLYEALTDALRKIQWAKRAGLRAVAIEREIVSQIEPDTALYELLGQMEHAQAVFTFVVIGKAALDSMAVFLTGLFPIAARKGGRDFKHKRFRNQVEQADTKIGKVVSSLAHWFDKFQRIRDERIHWSSTRVAQMLGPTEVGVLPIPKILTKGFQSKGLAVTKENYWSTEDFVGQNFSKLASLFNAIVSRCIEIETAHFPAPPPRQELGGMTILAFPLRVIENTHVQKLRVGKITGMLLSGGTNTK